MTSINSRNTAYDKSTGLTVGITHEDVVEEVRVFLATDERGLSKAVHIEKVTDMYVWFARSGGLRCWVALLVDLKRMEPLYANSKTPLVGSWFRVKPLRPVRRNQFAIIRTTSSHREDGSGHRELY